MSLRVRPRALAAEALIAGAVVALLTGLVVEKNRCLARTDAAISRWALDQVHRNAVLLRTAQLVTQFGNPVVIDVACGVAVILALYYRRWAAALAVVGARVISLGAEQVLKAAVARPRPHPLQPVAHVAGPSFPSGHSTGIAMLATLAVIGLLAGRRPASELGRIRWLATAVLVALVVSVVASRVLLGVHYPSDVVAGVGLGVCAACLAVLVVSQFPGQPARGDGAGVDQT